MKIRVRHKLFMAILAAAILSVVSSALIMQWSLSRSFLRFVNSLEQSGIYRLAAKLEDNYRVGQSWEFLRQDPDRWHKLVVESLPEEGQISEDPSAVEKTPRQPESQFNGKRGKSLSPRLAREFDRRLFLLDADGKPLINSVMGPVGNGTIALMYNGKTVGYLGLLPRTRISEAPHLRFIKEQKKALVLQAFAVVLLAALLSLLMARRLVRPLNVLAKATHQLAAGKFAVRVPVASQDELGQLAGDFNSLALALEKSELTRRQWVADISHELRTPLATLRGEIEALQDGIRQPGQDAFNSLHGEVQRLSRLVDDLYQVSLSDVGALTYRKIDLDLGELLIESVENYRSNFTSKGIALELEIDDRNKSDVFADPERLQQLFGNLLDNSLKYTDSGGKLLVTVQCHGDLVLVDFQDSKPGVSSQELDKLFERLYRVESSRNRATGGAGLGLTICRNIVEAHGGQITAKMSPLGGVWIRIELPGANP